MDVCDAVVGVQGVELAIEYRGERCEGFQFGESEAAANAVRAIIADVDVEPAGFVGCAGELSLEEDEGVDDCFY